jgi:hypothetical protein
MLRGPPGHLIGLFCLRLGTLTSGVNRHLEQRYEGTFMGQLFSGLGYSGYDNVAKKHWMNWMDTSSTGVMSMTGKWDTAGKVMTMTGTVIDPMTGKPCKITEKRSRRLPRPG